MSLTLKYVPDFGVYLNDLEFRWGTERAAARRLLQNSHSHFGVQRKDVYEKHLIQNNLFDLSYNRNDLLIEVEVHHGLEIIVANTCLSFENDIADVISKLEKISCAPVQIGHEQFLFKDLKLTIATAYAMGGDGNRLAYFYCSSSVQHLL
jgi:hypothetical protein